MMKKVLVQATIGGKTVRFDSMTDASTSIDGQSSHISECCNGIRKSHKGYEWERVEIDE